MKKILVIDYEKWLREMIQLAPRHNGYEMVEAQNTAAGIETPPAGQPGVRGDFAPRCRVVATRRDRRHGTDHPRIGETPRTAHREFSDLFPDRIAQRRSPTRGRTAQEADPVPAQGRGDPLHATRRGRRPLAGSG